MCKPRLTSLPIHQDGPCIFSGRSYGDACAAFSDGRSWRSSLANILHYFADKIEGTKSFVIVPHGPPQIAYADTLDAYVVGLNGATKYLNDLWRDRTFKETESAPILPSRPVS